MIEPASSRGRDTDVRADAQAPPDRQAITGDGRARRRKHGKGGERPVVPRAEFTSYYGKPILNSPTWHATDIAGYFFLGGLAGASSIMAAGAELSGRPRLGRAAKLGALTAISGSLAALIHDLGRPERFANMLRVVKPTSPMSMGSWLLALYGPQAGIAAATAVLGRFRRVGRAATFGAAVLGPAVTTYTAVLTADTAVPAWHDGFRELPFVFAGSAAAAAGGLGMVAAPVDEAGPARRAAVFGVALDNVALELMKHRMGFTAEPLHQGKAGRLLTAARALSVAGAITGTVLGRRSRIAAVAAGLSLLAGSACTRLGVFTAGVASAADPAYTVGPQRDRLRATEKDRSAHRARAQDKAQPPGNEQGPTRNGPDEGGPRTP